MLPHVLLCEFEFDIPLFPRLLFKTILRISRVIYEANIVQDP